MSTWDDIKPTINLAAVVTGLLGPANKRSGRRLYWRCPFHDDHDPSFQVDVSANRWRCYPCDLGGDAPELVMKLKGVVFPEAVAILGGKPVPTTAVSRKAENGPKPQPTLEQSSGLSREDADQLVTDASIRLWSADGAGALAHLRCRGLTDETIRAVRLGFTPSVSVPTRDGTRFWDVIGIVIPWFDGDRLALVKIRRPACCEPKYAEAFRDRPMLYPGPSYIRIGKSVVIVEGELDALLLGQELAGIASVITTGSASARPDPRVLELLVVAPVWYVATDADPAGDRGASVWMCGRSVRVRPPGYWKDWTEYHQAGFNVRRWWSDRLAGIEQPPLSTWEELAAKRWGPALGDPEPGTIIGGPTPTLVELGVDVTAVMKQQATNQQYQPPA
jgi:hypothetical protein